LRSAVPGGIKLKKLNSIAHRNILLRLAHGEIYSNERKYRHNLTDDPKCSCGEIDTVDHKFIWCELTRKIWGTITLENIEPQNEYKTITGATLNSSIAKMRELAEALLIINKDRRNYDLWIKIQKRLKEKLQVDPLLHEDHVPVQDSAEERGESSPD